MRIKIHVKWVWSFTIDTKYFWDVPTLLRVVHKSMYNRLKICWTLLWKETKDKWWALVNWKYLHNKESSLSLLLVILNIFYWCRVVLIVGKEIFLNLLCHFSNKARNNIWPLSFKQMMKTHSAPYIEHNDQSLWLWFPWSEYH